jgi:excinuclease ABC subunit A
MGAIKPIQTPAWQECQDDLMRHAESAGIPRDTPCEQTHHRADANWVIQGSPNWTGKWNQQWYGVKRFFEYLETQVLQDAHTRACCPSTAVTRRVATVAAHVYKPTACCGALAAWPVPKRPCLSLRRFMPQGVAWQRTQLESLPGLCLHDLMCLPIDRLPVFFEHMAHDDSLTRPCTSRAASLAFVVRGNSHPFEIPVRCGCWGT